jgi:hypothetical protein
LILKDNTHYLINKSENSRLRYETDEQLQKLLELSNSDIVSIRSLSAKDKNMTLEEVCKIIGEKVIAQYFDKTRNDPAKLVNLLTKEVTEGVII